MRIGLLSALGAALLFGLGTVLQALGARRSAGRSSPLLQPWTLVGTALDGVGVLLSLVALRSLPLFVVQPVLSANLAVAAVAARLLLGQRLRRKQQAAVLAVTLGLALVGLSATAESAVRAPVGLAAALAVAAALTTLVVVLDSMRHKASGVVLGVVAGCGFTAYAVAVRALPDLSVPTLLTSPTAWAGAVAGLAAFLALLRGLQRASVTTVMAPLVVLETVLPSLVGILALGDRPAAGTVPLAAGGFALAVVGAVVLATAGA